MTVRKDLMKRSACSSVARSELAQCERSSPDSSAAAADSDVPSNVLADVLADVLATPTPPASQPAREQQPQRPNAPTAAVQIQRASLRGTIGNRNGRLIGHGSRHTAWLRRSRDPDDIATNLRRRLNIRLQCARWTSRRASRGLERPRGWPGGEVFHRLADRSIDGSVRSSVRDVAAYVGQHIVRQHGAHRRGLDATIGRQARTSCPALEARCIAHAAALHHRDRHLDASFQKEPDQDCCGSRRPQAQGLPTHATEATPKGASVRQQVGQRQQYHVGKIYPMKAPVIPFEVATAL